MNIQTRMSVIRSSILQSGNKMTAQREAIVRVLLEHEEEHLSAEDVYLLVKAIHPEIGLATVYRNMDLLTGLQVIKKVNFGDGLARFDLRDDDQEHMHHHLICTRCSQVREVKEDWLVELEARLEREYEFVVTDHRLEFMGVYQGPCNKAGCRKNGELPG